jgi:iron complex transport system ATP-binding protein
MNLEMRAVSAGYGPEDVLRDVSLSAGAGRVLAVVGPNGSGKSTLLRVLCGLLRPRVGQVLAGGHDVQGLDGRQRARLMAFLPQHPSAPAGLSCRDLVMLGRTPHLSAYGSPSPRDHNAVQHALARVGATEMEEKVAAELSGGQRQRVFLARALAQEAPMLLLDEPIAHLDLKFQFQILKLVRDLTRPNAAASTCGDAAPAIGAIVILHHINLAASIADDMALMSQGRVVASGSPADVMRSELLQDVFEVPLSITPHPMSGRPQAQARWDFDAPF